MFDSFWINFIANLLATLIALVAGVPVGLWVDRKIKKREEERESLDQKRRELEILELIKKEIEFCKLSIFQYRGKQTYLPMPYKTGVWDAFCSSAEIKYISSPNLLAQIAHAYYYIKAESTIEQGALFAVNAGKIQEALNLLKDARSLDLDFENNASEAIKEIESQIKKINPSQARNSKDLPDTKIMKKIINFILERKLRIFFVLILPALLSSPFFFSQEGTCKITMPAREYQKDLRNCSDAMNNELADLQESFLSKYFPEVAKRLTYDFTIKNGIQTQNGTSSSMIIRDKTGSVIEGLSLNESYTITDLTFSEAVDKLRNYAPELEVWSGTTISGGWELKYNTDKFNRFIQILIILIAYFQFVQIFDYVFLRKRHDRDGSFNLRN